jgi:hypothetical protein
MKWKYHDATIWKLIQRRTGLSIPFTRVNDGDGHMAPLTPIESKHKSRDTVTGFAWVRGRRRSSIATRKSNRMRRLASNRSLSSQQGSPFAGPSQPTLRLRQSRSSDFRESGQVVLLPPLTHPPSYPISPVWGLDGPMHIDPAPRSSALPPSPIYGLDGIMEAHASTRPPPSRVTISFTQPRSLDQVMHEAQMDFSSTEDVAMVQTDEHPEESDSPPSAAEPISAPLRLPLRRKLLTLSKKRRRKFTPVTVEPYIYVDTQEEPSTLPGTPSHIRKHDPPPEDDSPDQEPVPREQPPPLEPPQMEAEAHQPINAPSRPSSPQPSYDSVTVSSREANEISLRIVGWLEEVAHAASQRGSSCSPSASFASRDDYADTRSSVNRHRRSPAQHSPQPTVSHHSPYPSSSETRVADVGEKKDGVLVKSQPDEECDVGSRASCEALVDFGSIEDEDEEIAPPRPARFLRSSSGSSERTLHTSPTIFDYSGDYNHSKRASTITPSTSRGTPSPTLPTLAPWDLDPTRSTITRVGDRWSATYLTSRAGHGRQNQKTKEQLEWKKQWRRRHGDPRNGCGGGGGSIGKGTTSTTRTTTTKIYWTNYHIPTTRYDSHWQPPPGFRPYDAGEGMGGYGR